MRHTNQLIATDEASIEIPSAAFFLTSLQFLVPIVFKATLFMLVAFLFYTEVSVFHKSLIVPAKIDRQVTVEEKQTMEIRRTFKLLWGHEASVGIIEGIKLGTKSIRTKVIDPVLVAVLLHTESRGKLNARSNKNFKGLMQTPSMTQIAEVDIMHGCRILDQKLAWKEKNPQADLRIALALYKGGTNHQAFNQADEVIRTYRQIKVQIAS